MEGPDQILLAKGVDGGFAPNSAIGLSEQRGRSVDDRTAPLEQGGCQTSDVPDAAASQCNDRRFPAGIALSQRIKQQMQLIPTLGGLAFGEKVRVDPKHLGQPCAVDSKYLRFAHQHRPGVS